MKVRRLHASKAIGTKRPGPVDLWAQAGRSPVSDGGAAPRCESLRFREGGRPVDEARGRSSPSRSAKTRRVRRVKSGFGIMIQLSFATPSAGLRGYAEGITIIAALLLDHSRRS